MICWSCKNLSDPNGTANTAKEQHVVPVETSQNIHSSDTETTANFLCLLCHKMWQETLQETTARPPDRNPPGIPSSLVCLLGNDKHPTNLYTCHVATANF